VLADTTMALTSSDDEGITEATTAEELSINMQVMGKLQEKINEIYDKLDEEEEEEMVMTSL
jgi:hypothetical protein